MTFIYVSTTADPLTGPITDFALGNPSFAQVLGEIASTYDRATTTDPGLSRAFAQFRDLHVARVPTSGSVDRMFLQAVLEELRVQESLEDRWQNLVRTVAPEAGDQQSVFQLLKLVIKQAQHDAAKLIRSTDTVPRIPYEQRLPPQFEQSLAEIVHNTQQAGFGASDGVDRPTTRGRRR